LKHELLPGTDGLTMLKPIRHWNPAIGVAHGPDKAEVVSTFGSTLGSPGYARTRSASERVSSCSASSSLPRA
jgi:hypothetical protein